MGSMQQTAPGTPVLTLYFTPILNAFSFINQHFYLLNKSNLRVGFQERSCRCQDNIFFVGLKNHHWIISEAEDQSFSCILYEGFNLSFRWGRPWWWWSWLGIIRYIGMIQLTTQNPHHASKGCYHQNIACQVCIRGGSSTVSDEGGLAGGLETDGQRGQSLF